MVTRQQTTALDPAADAAALLYRLGFAILVILLPAFTLVSRRGTIMLAPIGVALLLLARLIEASPKDVLLTCSGIGLKIARSRAGVAAMLLVVWGALSILWAFDAKEASDKLLTIIQSILIAVLGAAALPARMKASNLYLTGIGVLVTTATAAALLYLRPGMERDIQGAIFERGLIGLAIIVWPATAWLVSRGRKGFAYALAAITGAMLVFSGFAMPIAGYAVGVIVYGLVSWREQQGRRIVGWLVLAAFAGVPFLALVLSPVLPLVLPEGSVLRNGAQAWTTLVLSSPASLIAGHGLDSLLAALIAGQAPAGFPKGLPFEIWYELGFIGAALISATLYYAVKQEPVSAPTSQDASRLVPGLMACFSAAFVLACLGAGAAFPWWLMTLTVVFITFTGITRGMFRTRRPKAANLRG